MTIIEKWQKMMSSFADIKAAIIEKDGVVSGGYANYAKGVRSIYDNAEYTPEYTYPSKGGISERMAFLKQVKEEIRQAIIGGGVDCGEDVPLSEYGNKIREIRAAPQILTKPYTTIGYFDKPCNYQLEATDGTPPYTWSSDLWWLYGTHLNSDGTITGTPTMAGSSNCRITVTDAKGKSATVQIWLRAERKSVSVSTVGATEFEYDGYPHELQFVCSEYPDMEFSVNYRRKSDSKTFAHPSEIGEYVPCAISAEGKYTYNVDVDFREWWYSLTITEPSGSASRKMTKKRFTAGAIPEPASAKRKKTAEFSGIVGISPLVVPYHSDISDVILDQGASSQCGACAAVAARFEREYIQNGSTKNLSHTYVYGSDNTLDGEGMYLRTVMKIMRDGIPYETDWETWDAKKQCRRLVNEHMTDELKAEAYKLRGSKYYICGTWKDICNAARVTNGAVIIMVEVYDNWADVGSDGIVGRNSGDFWGYHFVRVKDYEILDNGAYKIRFQNSWGKDWGNNGYGYLLSDRNNFVEAMALVDDINEVVRKLKFKDVNEKDWSHDAIQWCADNDIIHGFEDGTFRPKEPATREQIATIIYNFARKYNLK